MNEPVTALEHSKFDIALAQRLVFYQVVDQIGVFDYRDSGSSIAPKDSMIQLSAARTDGFCARSDWMTVQ